MHNNIQKKLYRFFTRKRLTKPIFSLPYNLPSQAKPSQAKPSQAKPSQAKLHPATVLAF